MIPNRKKKLRQRVLLRQSFRDSATISVTSKAAKSKVKTRSITSYEIAPSDTSSARSNKKKTVENLDFAVSQVFEQELKLFRLVEIIRKKIFKTPRLTGVNELNLIETFRYISKKQDGNISSQNLLKFLNKCLKNTSKVGGEDIQSLMRRLNLDEETSSLSYLQFVNAILPDESNLIKE